MSLLTKRLLLKIDLGMELEFKRLAAVKAQPAQFYSANLPVNKFKVFVMSGAYIASDSI